MEQQRLRIRFYGEVQGVGFRYRTYHAAQRLGLTGWVENCPDGTVLAEIQGERELIDEMLGTISSGQYISITDMDVSKIPLDEYERDFSIKQ